MTLAPHLFLLGTGRAVASLPSPSPSTGALGVQCSDACYLTASGVACSGILPIVIKLSRVFLLGEQLTCYKLQSPTHTWLDPSHGH